MKMYIHEAMIRHWIGSDHDNKQEYISLLVELLNDINDVQTLRNDILELWEDTV
jgi:hypothetical protein